MPYSGPDDPDLPSNVHEMAKGDREEWVAIWNDAYERCTADDGEKAACETSAFAQANGVLKKKKENAMSKLRELWDKMRAIVEPELGDADPAPAATAEAPKERAAALNSVREQVWTALDKLPTWAWLVDVYLDGEQLYAVYSQGGLLYRADLTVTDGAVTLGEPVRVVEVHQPVGRTLVRRQADGKYRWLNVSATAVLNRMGEIDSTTLFDNLIARAQGEAGTYPYRAFFHLGGLDSVFRIGQCDFLARDGVALMSSGVYDDTPLAQAVARACEAQPDAWGDSIGYWPDGEPEMVEVVTGVTVPVYRDGTIVEISTLPENKAASLFTVSQVTEVQRMNKAARDALDALKPFGLTDADIETMVAKVDGINRTVADEGLITRQAGEAPTTASTPPADADTPPTAPAPTPAPPAVFELPEAVFEELVSRTAARVVETMNGVVERALAPVQQVAGEVRGLSERVATLQASDDAKIRAALEALPRVQLYRASQAPGTVLNPESTADQRLAAAQPKVHPLDRK